VNATTLSGRSVLVTGGAGFIGNHLVAVLAAGNHVTMLDDCSTGHPERLPSAARFVEGDIRDADALDRSVAGPVWSHSVNVEGTLAVLEFASNAAVYGDPERIPVGETDPTNPLSPCGIEKPAGDNYVRAYHDLYGLDTVALRFFNVLGPGQSANDYAGVISAFVERAVAGQPLTVHGDGEQSRDFVYIEDVVAACPLAGAIDHAGEAFNVGSGRVVTVNELAETILRTADSDAGVVHDDRPGDVPRSQADIAKAHELLGYEGCIESL
jgi:UDP-glucose 4-epimerase